MMGKSKGLHMVTFTLLVIGGLNWLLVGLLQWDLVGLIFGGMGGIISRVIYVLVGISAIVELVNHKSCCKVCGSASTNASGANTMGGMNKM